MSSSVTVAKWVCVPVLVATLAAAANAQADVRIYEGNLVAGVLTTAHPRTDRGDYHQHYLYDGRAGERVRVSASAPRLEVAVALYEPGGAGKPLADHGGAW